VKQAEEKNEEVNAQKARVVHRAQNGKLQVLEVKCFPFSDSSNEGIFLNVVDITQDIKLQEALDMSEQKDRLLRFVSHEFRTPLNCALALLGGLKSKISYSLSTEYLNPALNSCKLLLSLVNDLLDFSMIKEKKLKIFIQPCNLKKVFEEVIDLMESQATIQNLELNLVWDPEISRIFYTDQTRVQQILLNLISNALKFTRQGSITVKVTRIDTSIVRVEVRDTGVGISAKSLDNLFKEFSKLKENTHLNPQGIGLGLVISKLLSIELGPDNVGLTVEPGQEGTTFSFLLQAKTDDVMKGDYLNRTGEIDVSDDESRNKPAGLLNYMSRNFRTIEQATKPPAPLMSAIQEDTLRSANSNDINPEGYVKMNSKLLEFQAKLEVQTKGRVNRLGTVVKSNIIISTNNLLTDPIKVSAYSNERNVFKKKTMKNHLKRTKPKERAQSWGRSQTVALGDADFGASMIIWEFSILVHSLNTRCQCPKVLLVDDNAYNLLALTHQLRSLDLDSVSATDGEVAIQKVLNHQNHHPKCKNFSIIFMDVEMPRLNGFEATRQLRKKMLEGKISFIPIIGLSGHNPKEMRKECLLSGMNDMIIKPATPKMLQETILKWVEEAD